MIVKQDIKLIPLTSDFMFKRIFTKNPNILKQFLISVLELNINPEKATIEIISNELTKSNRKEYHKTVDMLVQINNNLNIDIEINTERFNSIKERNTLYLQKISVDTIESGNTYKSMAKYYFYQLNLNTNPSDKKIKEKYMILDEESHEPLLENFKIVCKSIENYREIYYNELDKSSNATIWLALLSSKNFDELKEMSSLVMNKNDREKFIEECKKASKDRVFLSEWCADMFAADVEAKERQADYEDGFNDGLNNGINKGINQNTTKIIKSMLEKNYSLKDISDITGKSIEEIKEIEKSMKD